MGDLPTRDSRCHYIRESDYSQYACHQYDEKCEATILQKAIAAVQHNNLSELEQLKKQTYYRLCRVKVHRNNSNPMDDNVYDVSESDNTSRRRDTVHFDIALKHIVIFIYRKRMAYN